MGFTLGIQVDIWSLHWMPPVHTKVGLPSFGNPINHTWSRTGGFGAKCTDIHVSNRKHAIFCCGVPLHPTKWPNYINDDQSGLEQMPPRAYPHPTWWFKHQCTLPPRQERWANCGGGGGRDGPRRFVPTLPSAILRFHARQMTWRMRWRRRWISSQCDYFLGQVTKRRKFHSVRLHIPDLGWWIKGPMVLGWSPSKSIQWCKSYYCKRSSLSLSGFRQSLWDIYRHLNQTVRLHDNSIQ